MPSHDDVGNPFIAGQPVEGRVGLDEPPMCLRGGRTCTSSLGLTSQSNQGDRVDSLLGSCGVWKTSRAHIICTQVVPLLDRVLMTMSPDRKGKSNQ